jgi:Fic family protein
MYEEHYWHAENDGTATRAKMASASGLYQSTIPASIARWSPLLPGDLAADVEEAAASLAQFDSHASITLGAGSPTLGPMHSILLRTESASSSQIENLTVGARQLALAELDQSASHNAQVVVGNVRAMEAALALADRLDQEAIRTMQAEIVSRQPGMSQHAGQWRDILVWVGSSSITPRGASHIAPQAALVPEAINDLIEFMARDDLPVLVQVAVAHAQFETIHPFIDGNGRTGRALVHALLRAKRLVISTTPPVSAGLLRATDRYFDALTAYRAGDARPIIEQFTAASRFAAQSGAKLVDDLAAEVATSRQKMGHIRPQSSAWKVLPVLIAQPVINARFLIERLDMNEVTAQRALGALSEAGVVEERTGKQRNRVWQHSGIIAILDEYGQSLRRG